MEKEKFITISDQDYVNMQSVENAANMIDQITQAILESPRGAHLQVQSNRTGEIIELTPTEALVFEGYFIGASNELIQAGYEDVVMGIAERHEIGVERTSDGEG